MIAPATKQKRTFSFQQYLVLTLCLAVLAGCAALGKKEEVRQEASTTSAPVAEAAPSPEIEAEITRSATNSSPGEVAQAPSASSALQENTNQSEAAADAMMASLAAKSKFDEEAEAEATASVPEMPVEPVQTRAAEPLKTTRSEENSRSIVNALQPKLETAPATPDEAEEKKLVTPTPTPTPTPAPAPEAKPKPQISEKVTGASRFRALNATRGDLPIEFGIWKIRKGEATLDKDIVITTPTWEMGEPGFMSQIWITLMDDKLVIHSSSDIVTPKGKSGIKIDGGDLISFDRVVEESIGVLDGEQWIERLAKADKLDIFMGFFPDRVPKSGIYQSTLTLEKLGRMTATYERLK